MRYLANGPQLVLSPHLDDAVYSAWSVLTGPGDVRVVNICTALPATGSCAPWDRVVGATDSRALMRLRLAEDREALAMAGLRPLNLGFLDAQYRAGPLDLHEVLGALDRALASVAEIYCPAGIGGHPDHDVIRELALCAGAEAGIPVFLYAELPYATRFGWPHSATGEPPRPNLRPSARWEEYLATASCGMERLAMRVTRLSEKEAARKLRVMETYRTQFDALNGGPLDLLRHRQVTAFEVLWELRPT
jgi:LmbE family N-acetylglucosaminyl deacetylase